MGQGTNMARAGDKNAFWDNAAVLANGNSSSVELSRSADNLAIWITVSGATTISLQAAHRGDMTSEGVHPDANAANWAQVYYLSDPIQVIFSGAGSAVLLVPDFVPQYIRLNSSGATTITAGWETTSN